MEALELTGRSVLVTGAYGLLGSWLVKSLLERGARVVALRRDEPAASALELLGISARVDAVHANFDVPADVLERVAG